MLRALVPFVSLLLDVCIVGATTSAPNQVCSCVRQSAEGLKLWDFAYLGSTDRQRYKDEGSGTYWVNQLDGTYRITTDGNIDPDPCGCAQAPTPAPLAVGQWVLADWGCGCGLTCSTIGLICSMETLHAHNHKVDTYDEMSRIISNLGAMCKSSNADYQTNGDVPAMKKDGACVYSGQSRPLNTFDCEEAYPNGRRLCWCHQVQIIEFVASGVSAGKPVSASSKNLGSGWHWVHSWEWKSGNLLWPLIDAGVISFYSDTRGDLIQADSSITVQYFRCCKESFFPFLVMSKHDLDSSVANNAGKIEGALEESGDLHRGQSTTSNKIRLFRGNADGTWLAKNTWSQKIPIAPGEVFWMRTGAANFFDLKVFYTTSTTTTTSTTQALVVNAGDRGPSSGEDCNSYRCAVGECCCSYCRNSCQQFAARSDTPKECGRCTPSSAGGTAQCYPGADGYDQGSTPTRRRRTSNPRHRTAQDGYEVVGNGNCVGANGETLREYHNVSPAECRRQCSAELSCTGYDVDGLTLNHNHCSLRFFMIASASSPQTATCYRKAQASYYTTITSGLCPDYGRISIRTVSECNDAAAALNLPNTNGARSAFSGTPFPTGCQIYPSTTPMGVYHDMFFNHNDQGHPCTVERTCICKASYTMVHNGSRCHDGALQDNNFNTAQYPTQNSCETVCNNDPQCNFIMYGWVTHPAEDGGSFFRCATFATCSKVSTYGNGDPNIYVKPVVTSTPVATPALLTQTPTSLVGTPTPLAATSISPMAIPAPMAATPSPLVGTPTPLAPTPTRPAATPVPSDTCCDRSCTNFVCPSNYTLKSRASSILEDRNSCCDPVCAGMTCPYKYVLKTSALNVVGNDEATCCDPSCDGYECPTNHISKSGASSILRKDHLSCCDQACSGFACPSNYMPKLTASRIVGNDLITCCEEESRAMASVSSDTMILVVVILAVCSLLALSATCVACKVLRSRQSRNPNVVLNELAYHTSSQNVTVNCTVRNPNSKGVNLQDVVTPSRWCVSIGQFFSFLDDVERCFTDGDPSCFEVADRLVKPATQASDCSYALMLNPAGIAATYYVVHSWAGCVFGLSAALRDAIGNSKDQGVWICILAIPQTWDFARLGNLLGADPYLSPFYVALSAVSIVLAIRDPTSNIYARLWCVFELWASHELGKEISTLGRMEISIDEQLFGCCGACTLQRDVDLLRPVLTANQEAINHFIRELMLGSGSNRGQTHRASTGCSNSSALVTSSSTSVTKATSSWLKRKSSFEKHALPEGKTYHYFMSHKKHHSRLGNISASLALAIHDALDGKGFIGFYDVDNLETIDKEALQDAVESSCAVLVCFTDETCESEWCRFEWEVARDNNIPTKGIVDLQNFDKKKIVEQIQETNPFILKFQIGEYTERTRKQLTRDVAQWLEKRLEKQSLGAAESSTGMKASASRKSYRSASSSKNSVSSSSTAEITRVSSHSTPEIVGKSTRISL